MMEWVENIDMMPESQKFGAKKIVAEVSIAIQKFVKMFV
jgi:hypothetical protein